jgi:fructokinase
LLAGVEAGGTKFICGWGTGPRDLVVSEPIPTTTPEETIARVVAWFGARRTRPRALGIAAFGPLDVARGRILKTTPKLAWRDCRLQERLAAALGVAAVADTDVNGAMLAESRWGAAMGLDPAVYITVGTGVGVGVMVNGAVVHGKLHTEAGHLLLPRLEGDAFAGGCPHHGACLEGLACGPAFAARLAAGQTEAEADRYVADALARGILNLTYTVSPHVVILGGGVMKRKGLLARVRRALVAHNRGYAPLPKLVRPGLGDRAGVLGAIALAGSLKQGR